MFTTREMQRFNDGVIVHPSVYLRGFGSYNGLAAIRDAALCWATIGPTSADVLNIGASSIVGPYAFTATVACLRRAGALHSRPGLFRTAPRPMTYVHLSCRNHLDLHWFCRETDWVNYRCTGRRAPLYRGSIWNAALQTECDECQCDASHLILAPADGFS